MIKQKAEIMDHEGMKRAIKRIAHEIIERNKGTKNIVLVGIQRRGVHIANRIAAFIKAEDNVDVPIGVLDITFYRDDLSMLSEHPVVNGTNINFSIHNKTVILVDDVIYTGRTVRTAIDALIDLGRPASIQLAELIDRGHRELPIRADYVGKNVPTSKNEIVHVNVVQIDGFDGVTITEIKKSILM